MEKKRHRQKLKHDKSTPRLSLRIRILVPFSHIYDHFGFAHIFYLFFERFEQPEHVLPHLYNFSRLKAVTFPALLIKDQRSEGMGGGGGGKGPPPGGGGGGGGGGRGQALLGGVRGGLGDRSRQDVLFPVFSCAVVEFISLFIGVIFQVCSQDS